MKRSESIAARFSSAADTYDESSDIQPVVAEKVAGLADEFPNSTDILDWGCGTGALLSRLPDSLLSANISALDISDGMIDQARKTHSNIVSHWISGDIRNIPEPAEYSLIISSSTIHWIRPLSNAFKAAFNHLQPGGHLVFGMMIRGTLKELLQSRSIAAPGKPLKQPLPERDDVLEALDSAGFSVLSEQTESTRIIHSSADSFLKALHMQGVTGGHYSNSRNMLNRTELNSLRNYYNKAFQTEGGVYATYHVLYIVAEKPPRAPY